MRGGKGALRRGDAGAGVRWEPAREGGIPDPLTIFTVGHSTRSIESFLAVLRAHGVVHLVDIRSYPQSRRHPHFGQDALRAALASAGICYLWEEELGGRRRLKARRGARAPGGEAPGASRHSGVRADAFRAYVEHLATPEASGAIHRILALARASRVALMCAERSHRRCHRQFLADRLKWLGANVLHIEDEKAAREHADHPLLRIREGELSYPPDPISPPPGPAAPRARGVPRGA